MNSRNYVIFSFCLHFQIVVFIFHFTSPRKENLTFFSTYKWYSQQDIYNYSSYFKSEQSYCLINCFHAFLFLVFPFHKLFKLLRYNFLIMQWDVIFHIFLQLHWNTNTKNIFTKKLDNHMKALMPSYCPIYYCIYCTIIQFLHTLIVFHQVSCHFLATKYR